VAGNHATSAAATLSFNKARRSLEKRHHTESRDSYKFFRWCSV